MNSKGQFSIIAALLVAVVLIAAVMTTYSAIRYGSTDSGTTDQPQILSSIDETNLGLKELLGFTVGYYGSVLKVTGNMSYAQDLARNYLQSGLNNIGDVRPEWGASISLNNLTLEASWFSNRSFSEGAMYVTYNLTGKGIYGVSYNSSARLDVQVMESPSQNQSQIVILIDEGEPLINLGKNNLKFFQYNYETSTWNLTSPLNIASYANGTYVLDLPPNIQSNAYTIEVSDTRGLMVEASSFTQFTSTLSWNSTGYRPDFKDFADTTNTIVGLQSNFAAQQAAPDNVYDTLTEQVSGLGGYNYYPQSYTLQGSTTPTSGTLNSLQSNDGAYMLFRSYPTAFGSSATFGYQTQGATSVQLNNIKGSRFTCTSGGQATSITAYLNSTVTSFGTASGTSNGYTMEDTIRGQSVTAPSTSVVAQSITAYIICTTAAKYMQAAIYDGSNHLIATTEERLIPVGSGLQTFTFPSPPTLTAYGTYTLVVCSQAGDGSADLGQTSGSGGRYATGETYGTWPSTVSFSSQNRRYNIVCNYFPDFDAQAAIYSSNGNTLVGITEEKTLNCVNGWTTFNFITQPVLSPATDYVLVIWSSDTSTVNVVSDTGTAEKFQGTGTYNSWPSGVSDQWTRQTYSIYCTYSLITQCTAQVEFHGTSDSLAWQQLIWSVDASVSSGTADLTLQLKDASTGLYPTSGSGFMEQATIGTSDSLNSQTITTNPTNFRDGSTGWTLLVTAVSSTTVPFDLRLDLVQYNPQFPNYALNVEEQFLNLNASNIRQDLCIKTGTMGAESLLVQVYNSGAWHTLMTLSANTFNNVSLVPYINSATLKIRFVGFNDLNDPTPDSWNIDSVYLKDEADPNFLIKLQQSTFTVELQQNGTMCWLGQNFTVTTRTIPIPPLPVKALHVNATINGVNQEVPFQIEDWASSYQIPLGLTNNATVFSNRQMMVFQLNSNISDFTVWWDGRDNATQTAMAYVNRYFSDTSSKLNNGKLSLQFGGTGFVLTSTVGSVTSTSNLMRINGQSDTTDPEYSYVIRNGTVRDIVFGEAEYSNGITNCSNTYTNLIVTLPAGVNYYTYQVRYMFLDTARARNISDLCPVRVSTSASSPVTQTENGTLAGFPIVDNSTATFANYLPTWTPHHFSQLITNDGKGVGLIFTNVTNQRLYAFDAFTGSTSKGALKASSNLLEMLPVSASMVKFNYAYDITWAGAVATFDSATTPICTLYDSTTPTGLWLLAEYPPILTVTPKN